MLMLIDTRQGRPWPLADGERPPVSVNWRIWSWLGAAVALIVVASGQAPLAGAALWFAAFACAIKALSAALDRCDGLRAHRQ